MWDEKGRRMIFTQFNDDKGLDQRQLCFNIYNGLSTTLFLVGYEPTLLIGENTFCDRPEAIIFKYED